MGDQQAEVTQIREENAVSAVARTVLGAVVVAQGDGQRTKWRLFVFLLLVRLADVAPDALVVALKLQSH